MPLEDSIAQYQRAAEDLREVTAKAHEATRDLKQTIREYRELRQTWLSTDELKERLDEASGKAFGEWQQAFGESIDRSTELVYRRFDTIMQICMGEDPVSVKEGKATTIELIQQFVRDKQLPVHITVDVHLMMNRNTAEFQRKHLGDDVNKITGHGFDDLPIVIDNRVPDYLAYMFLPDYNGKDKPLLIEFNVKSYVGITDCVTALEAFARKRAAMIPAGFGGTGGKPTARKVRSAKTDISSQRKRRT